MRRTLKFVVLLILMSPSLASGGTFLIAVTRGSMRWYGFVDALLSAATTTALNFLILLTIPIFRPIIAALEPRAVPDVR